MSDTVRTWRHIQQRYNLIGSKCTTCGELFFPSRVVCPNCRRKGNLEPFQFSGKGKIYTYSIIRSAPDDFKKSAPYAVAVIELEEGAKLTSQLVDCDVDDIEIGDDVRNGIQKSKRRWRRWGYLLWIQVQSYQIIPQSFS